MDAEYSRRIASVLLQLQEELGAKEYLKLVKRIQKAKTFEKLNDDDRKIIKKMEEQGLWTH